MPSKEPSRDWLTPTVALAGFMILLAIIQTLVVHTLTSQTVGSSASILHWLWSAVVGAGVGLLGYATILLTLLGLGWKPVGGRSPGLVRNLLCLAVFAVVVIVVGDIALST